VALYLRPAIFDTQAQPVPASEPKVVQPPAVAHEAEWASSVWAPVG
jgi:hypothetical protein